MPRIAIVCVLALACGKSSMPDQSSHSGGPVTHLLTVTTSGGGTVTSSPGGIDCGSICSASFAEGTQVTLTAAAGANASFSAWEGACSGAATCTVTMSVDKNVVARFQPIGFPPQTFKLTVTVSGSGSVTSSPNGIDCGNTCAASYAAGTRVQLSALPPQSAAWTAECLPLPVPAGACVVEMNKDKTAAVAFAAAPPPPPPPPPPPQDECAGLVPAAVAPVALETTQGPCMSGVADDGIGNLFVGHWAGDGPPFPVYDLFNAQGTKIASTGVGNDEVGGVVLSQPSGFTVFKIAPDGSTWFDMYSHEGVHTMGSIGVTTYSPSGPRDSAAFGVDPSGGVVTVDSHHQGGDFNTATWQSTYKRFDKAGNLEIAGVLIDDADRRTASNLAVSLSGDVLVFAQEYNNTAATAARWLRRDGTAVTGWFSTAPAADFNILADGSLVARTWGAGSHGMAMFQTVMAGVYADGKAGVQPLPDWLQSRAQNGLALVRDGKAYASWGPQGSCAGSVEIIAASTGKSCGCVAVSNLPVMSWVGRDGSLMAPRSAAAGQCSWTAYPQLLK